MCWRKGARHNLERGVDATQEAFLRAFRHFDTFRGTAIKPWLFAIVRNVCRTIRKSPVASSLDNEDDRAVPLWSAERETPEIEVVRQRDTIEVRRMLDELPAAFREVLVLREIDDLSYREIAEIVGVPVGTIMSRLARGRAMLRAAWLAGLHVPWQKPPSKRRREIIVPNRQRCRTVKITSHSHKRRDSARRSQAEANREIAPRELKSCSSP